MKKLIITMIMLLPLTGQIYEKAGTSGAQFFKISKSARMSGMGESCISLMGDVDQIYYNPAGVYGIKKLNFSLMYSRYMSTINFFNIAGKYKVNDRVGDFGLALAGMVIGQFENSFDGTTVSPTTQKLRAGTFMCTLNYSRKIIEYLNAGINLKIMNDKLAADVNDFNFAVDFGMIMDFGIIDPVVERLNLGIAFLNMGTRSKYTDLAFKIPFQFKSGISYNWLIHEKHELLSSMDFEKSNDRKLKFNVGLQYKIVGMFDIRFGYKFGDRRYGFKTGAGFKYDKYSIDYAFDYGEVGLNNRIEIGLEFPPRTKIQDLDGTVETLYYMGVKSFNGEDYDKSMKYFNLILKIAPNHERTLERIQELQDLQNKQRTLQMFEESMRELE